MLWQNGKNNNDIATISYRFMLQSINNRFFQWYFLCISFADRSRDNLCSNNFRLFLLLIFFVVIDSVVRLPFDVVSVRRWILPTWNWCHWSALVLHIVEWIWSVVLWMQILLKVWVHSKYDLCKTCKHKFKYKNKFIMLMRLRIEHKRLNFRSVFYYNYISLIITPYNLTHLMLTIIYTMSQKSSHL